MALSHDPPASIRYLDWHLGLKWRVTLDRALAFLEQPAAYESLLASLSAFSLHGASSQREFADLSGRLAGAADSTPCEGGG